MRIQLNGPYLLVLLVLLLGVSAVAAASIFSIQVAVLVAAVMCLLLWLMRPLMLPPGYGATKVRTLSVLGVFSLAASYGFWSQFINSLAAVLAANPRVQKIAPWIANVEFGGGPSAILLIFVAVCIWIVNHYMTDRTLAGSHPTPMESEFPEETFDKRLEAFCSALRQHLETTDREANWSPQYYADLEAEVEVANFAGAGANKRIVDLQTALRSDRSTQAYLVLGEPGSGKSVALRKLAREMLREVERTGRIPIYLNLREWLRRSNEESNGWTEERRPTVQELEAFVISSVKERGDVFTEEFVDAYFRKLWRSGRLYFVFDSFDEIPELLDADEDSWLISALSDVLSRFISSHPESRGLLASRVFRRPTEAFLAQKVLEIRALSEDRILQGLARFPAFTRELQASLFRDRLDLLPIARNPLLMALLGEWVNKHRSLPQTQGQLYENYLRGRLAKCATRVAQAGLTADQVLKGAAEIAWFVFQSPGYGLEAPVRVIQEAGATTDAAAIMDVLSYARIARVTPGEPKSFAFVHRRFLEYLVTTRLLNQPSALPTEHIPTDSRGRDALVLFAQLCDPASAEKLASLCWAEIQLHFDDPSERLRAIHCLRFLIDAFRSRREAVATFVEELGRLVGQHVRQGGNLIYAKIGLEGAGLLRDDDSIFILGMAMRSEDPWLKETAFRACRHLSRAATSLERSLINFVVALPLAQFWESRRSLEFSLSLSEALKRVHAAAQLRHRSMLLSAFAAPVALLVAPEMFAAAVAFSGLCWMLSLMSLQLLEVTRELEATQRRRERWWGTNDGAILSAGRRLPIFLVRQPGLQWLRQSWGGLLIGSGVIFLLFQGGFLTEGESSRSILLWKWYGGSRWLAGLVLIVLGMSILDWLEVRVWCGTFLERGKVAVARWKSLREFFIDLAYVATLIVGLPAMLWVVKWLSDEFAKLVARWGIEWVQTAGATVIGLAAILAAIGASIVALRRHLRNRRAFMSIAITDQMPRADIANGLESLSTVRWRLALVRRLQLRRTTATGDWPPSFRLAVGGDRAMTELAKLEERWLRLDR